MHQFIEAALIALQSIWTNKLRSFLTVLGNIVAVTSIIAVVSLVQGLNASVTDAIQSQVGADAFSVVRAGPTMTEEEAERAQSNPRVTLDDADAIRRFGTSVSLVMAESDASAQAKTPLESLDSMSIHGVSKQFTLLPTSNVIAGRLILPTEFDAGRHVTILGYDAADRLFGPVDPIGKEVTLAGLHFQVVGVAEQKGSIFGQSQDEFAIIPLTAFERIFGSRPALELTVRPIDTAHVQAGHGRDDRRASHRAPPAPRGAG